MFLGPRTILIQINGVAKKHHLGGKTWAVDYGIADFKFISYREVAPVNHGS
jgi:hypothetical protein